MLVLSPHAPLPSLDSQRDRIGQSSAYDVAEQQVSAGTVQLRVHAVGQRADVGWVFNWRVVAWQQQQQL